MLIEEDVEKSAGVSFTLDANVLFATGEDSLTSVATAALTDLTEKITSAGLTGKASVIGNTDDVGDPASNLELSRSRAEAVTKRLRSSLSGRQITLTAVGKGETDPLVANSSDANRARNRRVSVVFSGAQSPEVDTSDIAVPENTPADVADTSGAPDGSVVGTERTIVTGSDRTRYQIRLDVTQVLPFGDMVMIETTTQLLASSSDSGFSWYNGLFSGNIGSYDLESLALYDRASSQRLPVVIDGKGGLLGDEPRSSLTADASRTSWFLFPQPKAGLTEPIEIYVPAFGVLEIPASA